MQTGQGINRGRAKQKERTRAALFQSARGLIDLGRTPSVTEVADAAGISRRTAYRYFPTQEQLLTEAALERLRPQVEEVVAKARSVEEALDRLVMEVQRLAIENESLVRTMLRLSLERKLGENAGRRVRGSRRIDWIEMALEPLRKRLPKAKFDRLVSALAVCIGIEAAVILRDIRGLTGRRSIDVTRWTARAILDAAMRT